MKRGLRNLGALALLASLAGCTACLSPFDYCGPVTSSEGCQNCDFGARRNSMFHPTDGTPAATPFVPTPARPPAEPAGEIQAPEEQPSTADVDADATLTR